MVAAAHTPCQGGHILLIEKGIRNSHSKEDSKRMMGTSGGPLGNVNAAGNGQTVHIRLPHSAGWMMGPQWWPSPMCLCPCMLVHPSLPSDREMLMPDQPLLEGARTASAHGCTGVGMWGSPHRACTACDKRSAFVMTVPRQHRMTSDHLNMSVSTAQTSPSIMTTGRGFATARSRSGYK